MPMSSRRLEWMVAGCFAGWAAARLAGADRLGRAQPGAVPLLSFTPQAAAGAWASALLLRDTGAAATAAVAGAALTAAVAPRAMRHRQPPASGPVLRVLTANLRLGQGEAGPVVEFARRTRADVLFLQELTDDAADRLRKAGLSDLMPYQLTQTVTVGGKGSGIYARYPLSDGIAVAPAALAQPAARLRLPSGESVQLVCVHALPPRPAWSRRAVDNWRNELAALPPPGDTPVVLAGDFNATLDHAQFRGLLRRGYADAASQAGTGLVPTWGPLPYGRPALLAIDHILVDPRCAVRFTAVRRLPGSDHRVLFAEVRLPG
jgi:endonuclease/exonuclease/phosphatase family metal-dependent hydrolase